MAQTEHEKMLAGELYDASDPELVALRRRARKLVRQYNASDPDDPAGRLEMLQSLFAKIGPRAEVEPPFFCDYGSNIYAGDRVYMNTGAVILDCAVVHIGNEVKFGPGVHLYAATHPTDAAERAKGPELAFPIHIGDRCWIGGGVIVCPGVTIGENAVIGAGSVVTKNVPAGVVAAGNPCRVIRKLTEGG
ncbi:MAG: sugar O-acetyltransferase [Gemmataceae bacterium]